MSQLVYSEEELMRSHAYAKPHVEAGHRLHGGFDEAGRYIRYGKDSEEFYDTTKDPREWTNQIRNPKYAEAVAAIRAAVPALSETATPLPPVVRNKKTKKKKTK